jgi:lipopolysaccharide cholinephosphotransferase
MAAHRERREIIALSNVDTNPYPGDSLKRLQEKLKELLVVIDDVCKQLGIEYFIDSGTTLGAVRHGGFIPWDDDADVAMLYPDYLKFIEEAPAILPEGYSMHTALDTDGFTPLWTKVWIDGTRFVDAYNDQADSVQGIFVDIFPYVYVDDDKKKGDRQRKKLVNLQRMSYLAQIPQPMGANTFIQKAGCRVLHGILSRTTTQRSLFERMNRLCASMTEGERIINATYASGKPIRYDAIYPTTRIEFEDVELSAPRLVDEYLTDKYGDWRQLPPVEKRYTHAPVVLDFGDGVNVAEKND